MNFKSGFRSPDMDYLAYIKWPEGFIYEKCGHTKYCKGKLKQTRKCTSCGFQATPTSGTLFHIIYFMSTHKKGISSTELNRKLNLRQKACWYFRKKVTQAMKSSKRYPMKGIVEIDEMVIGQEEEGVKGRENDKKKLVIVGIEKKGKGVSRMYAKVVKNGSKQAFKPFFEEHISKDAQIRTDGWSTCTSFKEKYPKLIQVKSGKKGENFNDMHRVIMMLKGRIRGMHHSVDHLQDYLDEYACRFNRSTMNGAIFDNLLTRAVRHSQAPYKHNHILSA